MELDILVRNEITESHDRVWQAVGKPGTWLTARERISVAAETRVARACPLCLESKAALSPASVIGTHLTESSLSSSAIELVHRLVTDPGRITRTWVERLLLNGLSDAEYVEIAGLVSAVLVVDTFHAALGLPLRDMPEAVAGEPTRRRPRTATHDNSYVPMIPVDGLVDDYTDLYDRQAPWVPNVHRAFSLVPDATRVADDLMHSHYLPYERVPNYTNADHGRAIDKTQMELVASRVSIHNNCFY